MSANDPLEDLRAAWRGIEDLRAAWRDVEAPAPDEDAGTDALVASLRAAWRESAGGAAEGERAKVEPAIDERTERALVRARLRLEHRARFAVWRERAVLAAAGLLLCALVFAATVGPDLARRDPELAANDTDRASTNGDASDGDAADPTVDPTAPTTATDRTRRLDDAARGRALESGALELTRGRVRLVLGGGTTTVTTTTDEPSSSAAAEDGRKETR